MSSQDPITAAQMRRYSMLVRLLDEAFPLPGTKWRFGLDAIIGLIPGAGDIAMALVGGFGLVTAYRLGAPASVQLRMLMNLLVDAAIGAIPIAGDLFDFAFKAQVRNARLLERWLQRPARTRRSSVAVLVAMLAVLVGAVVGVVWVAIEIVRAVIRWIGGA